MRNAELIFIPTPTVGHLVSILEFARRLIDQDDTIRITILLMRLRGQPQLDPYARSLASSQPFVQIIDVPELEDNPTSVAQSVEAHVYTVVEKNIPLVRNIIMDVLSSRALDGVQVKVTGLVLDFFCLPMVDLANEVSLPPYVFLTTNAGFLSLMQYLSEHGKDTSPFERNSEEELSIQGFVNPIPTKVLPSALFWEDGYDAYLKLAKLFAKAKGVLVNTSIDIEPYSMNHFLHGQGSYPPVYPVGPVLDLNAHPHPDLDLAHREEVIKWLDHQPEGSVVFLCFGSMGRLPSTQVKEIANGLELCRHRFLWSLRTEQQGPDNRLLPEGFLERISGWGMVCGFAPQVEILAHKAVGGFVSHCGWNSILESLWFGVPIVTWPMYAEQQLNAFMMVKELGIAAEMRMDYRARSSGGELVMANEIENGIRCLMEGKDKATGKKVKEVSRMARKAVMNGGSSFVSMEKFIHDIRHRE